MDENNPEKLKIYEIELELNENVSINLEK